MKEILIAVGVIIAMLIVVRIVENISNGFPFWKIW